MPERSASASEPTTGRAPGRLVGIDVARAIALLGMVATHTLAERTSDGSLSLSHMIASGRASALFAVLAGVSLALLTGRRHPFHGSERVARSVGLATRALFIAAIGLTLGLLDSGLAVILTYYGLLFLLALPFVGLGSRGLFIAAGVWALAAPVLSQVVRPGLPERGFDSPAWTQLVDPARLLSELAFTGYYPVVPWLTYVLVGMGIGRLPLHRRSTQGALILIGTGLAVVATAASRLLTAPDDVRRALGLELGIPPGDVLDEISGGLFGVTPEGSWSWLLVVAPHSATPFDLVQTGGCALAVIGACLLVVGALRGFGERFVAVVFGAGTMTLTLYSLHVVMRTEEVWPSDNGPAAFRSHVLVVFALGALFVAARLRGPMEVAAGWFADRVRGWVQLEASGRDRNDLV
ncbi:heparan-alpha-glucosaminide N-acetyltransferase domain-containing protein [Nocardioides salsibiostraticola]